MAAISATQPFAARYCCAFMAGADPDLHGHVQYLCKSTLSGAAPSLVNERFCLGWTWCDLSKDAEPLRSSCAAFGGRSVWLLELDREYSVPCHGLNPLDRADSGKSPYFCSRVLISSKSGFPGMPWKILCLQIVAARRACGCQWVLKSCMSSGSHRLTVLEFIYIQKIDEGWSSVSYSCSAQ
jgi:hypothetical protein